MDPRRLDRALASPGEDEQQALGFLVGERLDHRGPYISEYRRELLCVDRSSVVEDDAQRSPIGRGHLVRKLRRVLDVSG